MLSLDYYGLSLMVLITVTGRVGNEKIHSSLIINYWITFYIGVLLHLGVSCDQLTAVKTEESSSEDTTVTLSYKYHQTITSSDNFFWYRQHPGEPPEFLVYISGTNVTRLAESLEPDTKLSAKLSGDKHVDLQISSAAVTDSAVYYCAVRPTVTTNPQSVYKNTSCWKPFLTAVYLH